MTIYLRVEKLSISLSYLLILRFCTFMNDDNKEMFLKENADNAPNQEFIKKAATPAYQFLSNVEGQRIIKTHFPFSMLPPTVMQKKAKVCQRIKYIDQNYLWFHMRKINNGFSRKIHLIHNIFKKKKISLIWYMVGANLFYTWNLSTSAVYSKYQLHTECGEHN